MTLLYDAERRRHLTQMCQHGDEEHERLEGCEFCTSPDESAGQRITLEPTGDEDKR